MNLIGKGTKQFEERIFTLKNDSSVASNDVYYFDPETDSSVPNAKKYMPFDSVTINNDSDENWEFYVNGNENQTIFVPAKTVKSYNRIKIRMLKGKNLGTTTTSANEIIVEFQKEVFNADKQAELSLKKRFRFDLFDLMALRSVLGIGKV